MNIEPSIFLVFNNLRINNYWTKLRGSHVKHSWNLLKIGISNKVFELLNTLFHDKANKWIKLDSIIPRTVITRIILLLLLKVSSVTHYNPFYKEEKIKNTIRTLWPSEQFQQLNAFYKDHSYNSYLSTIANFRSAKWDYKLLYRKIRKLMKEMKKKK